VNYAEFRAVTVVNLAVGVPDENLFRKQDGAGCNVDVGVSEEKWLENKMARDVAEPTESLTKTWFENKIAWLVYVLEGGRRSAKHADW